MITALTTAISITLKPAKTLFKEKVGLKTIAFAVGLRRFLFIVHLVLSRGHNINANHM